MRNCLICKKEFKKKSSTKGLYCSFVCYNLARGSGIRIHKECKKCGALFLVQKCNNDKNFCSSQCYWESLIGIARPPRGEGWRKSQAEARRGDKSHLWRGGLSIENKRIRASIDFRLWREAVFARDNWTCQECKVRGGVLHPHHIKSFALFPELRFAIDNGLTLCESCHMKTDSYLKRVDLIETKK